MARMNRMAKLAIMRNGRERDRYGGESRFRDRTGREHYDDGRFAPMRNDTNIEIEGRFRDNRTRNETEGMRSTMEPESRNYRRDDMGRFRSDYDMETYGAQNRYDGGQMARENWERRGGMNYGESRSRSGDYGSSHYPYGPFPVYRGNAGMRGGGEMNPIGFDANREWDGDRYGMNANYEMRNETEYRPGMRMEGGHAMGMDEEEIKPMSKEMAEKWVHSMKGANGSRGQHWNMEQAKQIMTRYGYQADPVEFYVALNMMKSDYTKAAQKVGADKEEFYAAMADAFLNDEDAKDHKLVRYCRAVVKHE